jgi:L-amino acid N-acyltransferase YncA
VGGAGARLRPLRLRRGGRGQHLRRAAGQGRGVGRALLDALVASAERAGIWTVQTGIFPENRASVRLHQACGFRVVGVRERIGRLHGRWRDVLLLERRSPRIT